MIKKKIWTRLRNTEKKTGPKNKEKNINPRNTNRRQQNNESINTVKKKC